MNTISIWGLDLSKEFLNEYEIEYLENLPAELPNIEWVFNELDKIWLYMKLDNSIPINQQNIGAYYSHPAWLMNGIFSSVDPVSYANRVSIAKYIHSCNAKSVADYGGGFGELALSISKQCLDTAIYIIEPFPTRISLERIKDSNKIKYASKLSPSSYDVVIAQDVLEHLDDPVFLAYEIANSLKKDGKIIFANCFFPLIQCHLPSTFHLRFTFKFVMYALGLRFIGVINGAEHALVFTRDDSVNLPKARIFEFLSRLVGPFINNTYILIRFIIKRILNTK